MHHLNQMQQYFDQENKPVFTSFLCTQKIYLSILTVDIIPPTMRCNFPAITNFQSLLTFGWNKQTNKQKKDGVKRHHL